MNTVAIIGGGASGMMAALSAAENPDNRVIIYERQQRVGRKLLSTGNGRCNLTNLGEPREDGVNRDFTRPVLERFGAERSLAYFRRLGLYTVTEYGGRVYPLSNSANSVLDVLRFALVTAGVQIRAGEPVTEVRRKKRGFVVVTGEGSDYADRLIVACGGMAGGKVGGVKDGYELLKSLGHSCTKLYPALVQLTTDSDLPRALKGVRCHAGLTVRDAGGRLLDHSEGELQFTEKGLSGTVSFDVSRAAARYGIGGTAELDFGLSASEYIDYIRLRRETMPGLETGEVFTGLLQNRLGRLLVKRSGVSADKPVGQLSEAEIEKLACACRVSLRIRGTEGFDSAQVTCGGISTEEFDAHTLQSRLVPGLYACGEVLDVDFPCGGFNLKWAWASGYVAGKTE